MKRRLLFAFLGLAMVAGSATSALAEGTSCGQPTTITPDGRAIESFIGNASTFHFYVRTELGRSYSIEVRNTTGIWSQSPAGGATVDVFSDAGVCTVVLASTDTANMAPRMHPSSGIRRSFTATSPQISFAVTNSSGIGLGYTFSVSETTQFSPAWSTGGTNETFYAFNNTTGADISASLTLTTIAGTVLGPFPLTLTAGRTTSRNTSGLGVADNLSGSAMLTHNGPPGSVLSQAVIANLGTVPPYNQVVKFQPVRE